MCSVSVTVGIVRCYGVIVKTLGVFMSGWWFYAGGLWGFENAGVLDILGELL